MIHACVKKFDVIENFKKFCELNMALNSCPLTIIGPRIADALVWEAGLYWYYTRGCGTFLSSNYT